MSKHSMKFTEKLFGTHSERELKRIYPIVDKIEALRPTMQALTDESFTPAIPARVPSGLPPIGRLPIPLHDSAKSATTTVSIAEPNGE